ncbi:MAG: SocA family protein [Myxacorys chilensis ATA2-1-KO14]|jgi:hypothetical protein|nr:SocA family protein [Myxacorys chilensis ATA2-1-KO14]
MLESLILYFVYKTKGFITKTQLVKFLYLADLYSVKWTGNQLTQLNWYYYNYGPWDEEIDDALSGLEDKVTQRQEGNSILIQVAGELPEADDLDLSEGLRLMLENIRKEWAGLTSEKINELLDHVYSTAPMAEAKSKHKPEDRAQLNLQLERKKLLEELGV